MAIPLKTKHLVKKGHFLKYTCLRWMRHALCAHMQGSKWLWKRDQTNVEGQSQFIWDHKGICIWFLRRCATLQKGWETRTKRMWSSMTGSLLPWSLTGDPGQINFIGSINVLKFCPPDFVCLASLSTQSSQHSYFSHLRLTLWSPKEVVLQKFNPNFKNNTINWVQGQSSTQTGSPTDFWKSLTWGVDWGPD